MLDARHPADAVDDLGEGGRAISRGRDRRDTSSDLRREQLAVSKPGSIRISATKLPMKSAAPTGSTTANLAFLVDAPDLGRWLEPLMERSASSSGFVAVPTASSMPTRYAGSRRPPGRRRSSTKPIASRDRSSIGGTREPTCASSSPSSLRCSRT